MNTSSRRPLREQEAEAGSVLVFLEECLRLPKGIRNAGLDKFDLTYQRAETLGSDHGHVFRALFLHSLTNSNTKLQNRNKWIDNSGKQWVLRNDNWDCAKDWKMEGYQIVSLNLLSLWILYKLSSSEWKNNDDNYNDIWQFDNDRISCAFFLSPFAALFRLFRVAAADSSDPIATSLDESAPKPFKKPLKKSSLSPAVGHVKRLIWFQTNERAPACELNEILHPWHCCYRCSFWPVRRRMDSRSFPGLFLFLLLVSLGSLGHPHMIPELIFPGLADIHLAFLKVRAIHVLEPGSPALTFSHPVLLRFKLFCVIFEVGTPLHGILVFPDAPNLPGRVVFTILRKVEFAISLSGTWFWSSQDLAILVWIGFFHGIEPCNHWAVICFRNDSPMLRGAFCTQILDLQLQETNFLKVTRLDPNQFKLNAKFRTLNLVWSSALWNRWTSRKKLKPVPCSRRIFSCPGQ